MEVFLTIVGGIVILGITGFFGFLFTFNGRLVRIETKVSAIEEHLKGE